MSKIFLTLRRLTLLLLLLNSFYCYSQPSKETDSLFKIFKNDVLVELNIHSDKFVFDDDTKISYYTLLANSTANDLLVYLNDDNPIIRSYIFLALLEKGISDSLTSKILEKHKNDTTKYTLRQVSVVKDWTVIDYMKFTSKRLVKKELNGKDYNSRIEQLKNKRIFKIDGLQHGFVDKSNLLNIDCLELTIYNIKVISFTLYVGEEKFISTSCNLTTEMKVSIEKAESGQTIYIENLKAIDKSNKILHLADSLLMKLK